MKIGQSIINAEIDESCQKLAKTVSTIDEATPNLDAYLPMKHFMDLDENWMQRQTIDEI